MTDLDVRLADAADQGDVAALEAQVAGLSQRAADQVEHHLEERPPTSIDDVQWEIDRARAAEDALQESARLRHEQDEHLAAGDLHGAHDLAGARAYELTIADDQGAWVDRPLVQAQQDVSSLSWGAHEQSIADDHTASAAAYAAAGDHDHASQYEEQAAHHESAASSYADSTSHHDAATADDGSAVDTTQTEG